MIINISTSPAVFRWKPACWLRVTGDDAATFLQGQFTNDLRGLAAGGCAYGLWLTVKGKVLADSFVVRGTAPNEFWIGSYFSPADVVRQRIESHVIADDVVVDDQTSRWVGTSVLGAGDPPFDRSAAAAVCFPGRRAEGTSVECIYAMEGAEPDWLRDTTGLPLLSDEDMERRRIAAGIPAVPRDVGPGDLPNEAGLETVAISYTKGCYLGQEVMARLKSMGQVRRRLLRVKGDGPDIPRIPAPVFAASRQVGELRSAVSDDAGGWIGLAMLSMLHVSPTTNLSLVAEGPPVLRVIETP